MLRKFWQETHKWLWLMLVVLLPITSMPLVRDLIGSGTSVAAPSGILLLFLVLFWLIPYIFKGGVFPLQSWPLIIFAFIAVLATCLAVFLPIPPYKDNSVFRNNLEAILTLGMGCCFFLVAMLYPSNQKILEQSLRWLNWSGLVMLIWAFIQAGSWLLIQGYPDWMRVFHGFYSVGALYRQRVSGFALEPSWFAHQLNMLYVPIWLAFTVSRRSVHHFRVLGITFENILLLGGITALGLTLSRIGFLAFLLMMTYVFILGNIKISEWMQAGLLYRWGLKNFVSRLKISPKMLRVYILIVMILVYLITLSGLAFSINKIDPRMAKMFQLDINRPDAFMYYANELTFASRIVYWQAGWDVFAEYPFLGVGLGNAGFFMPQKLSSYSWRLVEIRDLLYRSTSLFNIKAIWVRILAETGIVGFAFFMSWLFVLWQTAKIIKKSSNALSKTLALVGHFVLLGFIAEGFSIDSFALPYFWLSLGIFMAGSRL